MGSQMKNARQIFAIIASMMEVLPLLTCSILLLSATAAISADSPTYDGDVLTLPRVDTPSQVGQYQDVTFQLTPQGSWTLTGGQVFGVGTIYQMAVNHVEVVKTATFPVSVYLRVSGNETSCDTSGPARFYQRLQGSHFDIDFSAPHLRPFTFGTLFCIDFPRFKETVPLQVYGLNAGTYSYNVNGISGTFTLDSDNKFQDDCVIYRSSCPISQ